VWGIVFDFYNMPPVFGKASSIPAPIPRAGL